MCFSNCKKKFAKGTIYVHNTTMINSSIDSDIIRQKRYGIFVVAASWLAVFSLFGVRASFAMLKDPISLELGWSQSRVTLGYSLMMVFYAVTAFFSGSLLDRKGPKSVYAAAAVLGSVGLFAASRVSEYLLYLLFFGVLAGISTGMLWVTSTVSVRKWYIHNRYATMWGFAFMGAPISQFLMAFIMGRVLSEEEPATWRTGMMLLALIVAAALIGAFLLTKKSPEEYGFSAFGSPSDNGSTLKTSWTLKEAFSIYPIWGVMAVFLANMMGEFLIWTQVVSYWSADLGWTQTQAVRMYGTIGMVGVVSMPLMGKCADLLVGKSINEAHGRTRILSLGALLGVGATVLLLLSGLSSGFALAACILFAFYWAVVPGGVVGYTGAVYGRAALGRIWGMATLIVMGIGPFTGSFLGGFFKDLSGTYTVSLIFALSCFFAAFLLTFTLPKRAD